MRLSIKPLSGNVCYEMFRDWCCYWPWSSSLFLPESLSFSSFSFHSHSFLHLTSLTKSQNYFFVPKIHFSEFPKIRKSSKIRNSYWKTYRESDKEIINKRRINVYVRFEWRQRERKKVGELVSSAFLTPTE